jgi:hypothetical protein
MTPNRFDFMDSFRNWTRARTLSRGMCGGKPAARGAKRHRVDSVVRLQPCSLTRPARGRAILASRHAVRFEQSCPTNVLMDLWIFNGTGSGGTASHSRMFAVRQHCICREHIFTVERRAGSPPGVHESTE